MRQKGAKKTIGLFLTLVMCLMCVSNVFTITTHAAAISAEEMARKFEELKAKYPEGSYWNGSYKVNGAEMSWQCMGWAETVCDYLFGENPRAWVQQTNFNNLCVGDHVRINNNGHSIVITNMVGDTIYYADCNAGYDGRVHWNKTMTRAQLISKTTWFKSQPNNWVRTLNGVSTQSSQQSTSTPSSVNEGVYNVVNVDSGRYLNVYAGNDWDGVNVCVWDRDGSPEQNMKIVHRGGSKYAFYPQSSNGRVIDANRGSSYSNPLKAGNNIDLWQTNDAPAQEWYLIDCGGGKYSIELAAARGLVISCDNPWANNGNCSLQAYDGSNKQLWYLKRTDGGSTAVATPTPKPTPTPTPTPTPKPTLTPTATPIPTSIPTQIPTAEPTVMPTSAPTVAPTIAPIATPMPEHTEDFDQAENNIFILTIGSKQALVYGEMKFNDVAPVIRNNRTMLPARFVAENLGAVVSWDDYNQQVIITKGDIKIVLTIGLPYAIVNGEYKPLDCAPFLENWRTYTPVRLIAESLGAKVDWDDTTQSVIITR